MQECKNSTLNIAPKDLSRECQYKLFDNRISQHFSLVGKRDLAALLDISVSVIDKWVCAGKIPHFKLGKLVKFRLREVEAWLEERSSNGYRKNNFR